MLDLKLQLRSNLKTPIPEKVRAIKVRERLENDENIFDHIKLTGSTSHERVIREQSDADRVSTEKKWKDGKVGAPKPYIRYKSGDYPDQPDWVKDAVPPANLEVKSLDHLVCSFCGDLVHVARAHHGLSKLKIKRIEEQVWDDPVVIDETVIVTPVKVIACPEHAHFIRALTHIECKTCGMSQKKCKCVEFVGIETIKKQQSNTYSEG